MQMDEGLDTGEIIKKFPCSIEPTDTNKTLQDRLAELGAHALLESLKRIESDHIDPNHKMKKRVRMPKKLISQKQK